MNLAVSPQGHLLAASCRAGVVRLWNPRSRLPLAMIRAHQGRILALAFSPDGLLLATVGEDWQGKLWDVGGLAESKH
jgi:WD40 repeat protein